MSGDGCPAWWEAPEQVEKFAARDPDLRLRRLLPSLEGPGPVRVLDLGCAGGRNSVLAARRGFDVWALDASEAMVEETRRRLAAVLGPEEAGRRVARGTMDDLGRFPPDAFRLVVALGIFHAARSAAEWDRAVGETARVLEDGGLALVASFAPGTDLTGDGMTPAPGTRHVYRGAPSGPMFLLDAAELDAAMARHGLRPVEETETVRVESSPGRRVTVNGLYRRSETGPPAEEGRP